MTTMGAPPDPSSGLGLSAYLDRHLGAEGGSDLAATVDLNLLSMLLSAKRDSSVDTNALWASFASTVFWQAFLHSDAMSVLWRQARSTTPESERHAFVVAHGQGRWPRHDAIVFDPTYPFRDPFVLMEVRPSRQELRLGSERFLSRVQLTTRTARASSLLLQIHADLAIAVAEQQPFGLIITQPPPTESTASVPAGVIGISNGSPPPLATAGILAMDEYQRQGVTSALHAVGGSGYGFDVNGVPGRVISTDVVSDSCFIQIPWHGSWMGPLCHPLSGVTPRVNEPVTFDGAISGPITTVVSGWDSTLPFIIPQMQSRVLTPAVSNPGDSGAALIDGAGNVIGFAFVRTGVSAAIQFAAWIWAESVFIAHKLQ